MRPFFQECVGPPSNRFASPVYKEDKMDVDVETVTAYRAKNGSLYKTPELAKKTNRGLALQKFFGNTSNPISRILDDWEGFKRLMNDN